MDNARGVRNLFEQILTAQCNRLAALETLSREDLMRLTCADVETVRALPEKNAGVSVRRSCRLATRFGYRRNHPGRGAAAG